MDDTAMAAMEAWGDKSTRDTAHLLDLAIAGTIDHLRGHGTARIMPARLEEIADRIAPRTRDADGAWIVTLLPPENDLVAVNPYDVLEFVRSKLTIPYEDGQHDTPEKIAALVTAAAVPGITLRDLAGTESAGEFVLWVKAGHRG